MGSCYLGSFISRQSTKQTATLKKNWQTHHTKLSFLLEKIRKESRSLGSTNSEASNASKRAVPQADAIWGKKGTYFSDFLRH